MKKLISLILMGVMLFAGCTAETALSSEAAVTDTETVAIEEITEYTPTTSPEVTAIPEITTPSEKQTTKETTTTQVTTLKKLTETMVTTTEKSTTATQPPKQTTTAKTTPKQTKATTTQTTISETEVTEAKPELKAIVGAPDIVFVLSHTMGENILGFYITNKGEVKMYDFRNINNDEIYDIVDVYDQLEEAACDEIPLSPYKTLTLEGIEPVSYDDLTECYKLLKQIDPKKDLKVIKHNVYITASVGINKLYGIRYDKNGKMEIILLDHWGDNHSSITDPYDLNEKVKELMPREVKGGLLPFSKDDPIWEFYKKYDIEVD